MELKIVLYVTDTACLQYDVTSNIASYYTTLVFHRVCPVRGDSQDCPVKRVRGEQWVPLDRRGLPVSV